MLSNPFPASGQASGHPRLENEVDDQVVSRVQRFDEEGHPSQVLVMEGTQGVGKTNLLNYYEEEFRDYYGEEAFYIIRYYPDPEPSFDTVLRRIFQSLNERHLEKMGERLASRDAAERDRVKDVARSHDVRLVLNSLEKAAQSEEELRECGLLAQEWLLGLRVLNRHRERLGVSFRLDTVESRTQALRDIVYVSEALGLLEGILLLLDELEKQDYSLSKTPVLRFLSAIRALIDAFPSRMFLILAMTPQARLRYFAMLPAFAGRLQDTVTMEPMKTFAEADRLWRFYVSRARAGAAGDERTQGRTQGQSPVFGESEVQTIFRELKAQSDRRGTEGVTQRNFLHHLHGLWEQRLGSDSALR